MKNNLKYQKRKTLNTENLPIIAASRLSVEECLNDLATADSGLTVDEAKDRLNKYGTNGIAQEKELSWVLQFINSFNNPFIIVLFVLAIMSFCVDYIFPSQKGLETKISGVIIIIIMILLSGILRFWQEFRTNKVAIALKSLVKTKVDVKRKTKDFEEGIRSEINVEDLVPGDIVYLSAGDLIPADMRLLYSKDLFISQSALTGESLPVEKHAVLSNNAEKDNDNSDNLYNDILSLDNVCLMGTNVSSGNAIGVVVSTGSNTYFGSIAKSIVGKKSKTSFDKGVNSVSWLLIRLMIVMVLAVFVINGLTKGEWMQAILFAVAVAVGFTPEMLPMIVSANLSKGAIEMLQKKVVVKRLNSIQNLGAMDVLCTDKTGTLTQDEIVLSNYFNIDLKNDDRILQLAWLNSFHQSGIKNLIDKAILNYADEREDIENFNYKIKVDEIPFNFERRRLSIVVGDYKGMHTLICKGAVEEMLNCIKFVDMGTEITPITEELKDKIFLKAQELNNKGFRVLLLAIRHFPRSEKRDQYSIEEERDLILQGFLTFIDPPKESTAPALAALKENGVQVKILTGDNSVITNKICADVGLEINGILCGNQIETMSDLQLKEKVETHNVFVKLTPIHKIRILKALQTNGHTVGFLGDGINDAPALREADVSISVDSGTDIAKESADMIMIEKDLMVIKEGIVTGREAFGNITKYLNMTVSSNFGNVFTVLIASAFIPFLPMLSIHLLLQNLLYDISQMSLPWDKMDKEFLKKPRKWDTKNIKRFMVYFGPTSSIFDITTFAVLWYIIGANSVEHQALFQSGWFVEGLLSQTLVVHMLRTKKIPFVQSTATLPVLLLTGAIMILGIYIPFSDLGTYIGLVPLPKSYFPWLVSTLVLYCVVVQLMKRIYVRRFGQWF